MIENEWSEVMIQVRHGICFSIITLNKIYHYDDDDEDDITEYPFINPSSVIALS